MIAFAATTTQRLSICRRAGTAQTDHLKPPTCHRRRPTQQCHQCRLLVIVVVIDAIMAMMAKPEVTPAKS